MSAVLSALRRDPVQRLQDEIQSAGKRIEKFSARADELQSAIDAGDAVDAAKVVSADREVESAKSERVVLEKALAAAVAAAKKEAARQAAVGAEARRRLLVARAEALQVELVEVLTRAAVLAGENESIRSALPGPDAMRFWIVAALEAASKAACKNVRPKTVNTESVKGVPYSLVTNPMVRTLDLQITCPLMDVD